LIGNGVWQRIALTPYDVLNFGGVAVNKTKQGNVNVSNTGATDITITGVEIKGADASMFKRVDLPQTIIIAPEINYIFTFEFTPTSAGVKNAELVITHELGTSAIGLSGVGQIPNMVVGPDKMEFGNIQIGNDKFMTVEVKNTGEANLKLRSLKISGADASSYGLFSEPQKRNPDIIIYPTAAYTGLIRFTPSATGQKTATLEVITDAITKSITLNGNGVNQQISVDEPENVMGDGSTLLFQSSPNPVRSGYDALIKYRLSGSGQINLVVYDVLGREVAKLADEYKPQGIHSVNFSTKGLPSGVYFYKLRAPGYEGLKKMLIVR
jgi:hypothetical protein